MPLDKINKLCSKCVEKCKQWAFVTVIRCPFYESKNKQVKEQVEVEE
jgi:hypothetical protein